MTATPTASKTSTPVIAKEASKTFTHTFTATATPTTKVSDPTKVPTPQPSSTQGCNAPLIGQVLVSPNPSCSRAERQVCVKLGCGCDNLCVSIYSLAGEKICEWTEYGPKRCGDWAKSSCPQGITFPNGSYYAKASVSSGELTESAICKFMVLN
jgi:hypothetical protein